MEEVRNSRALVMKTRGGYGWVKKNSENTEKMRKTVEEVHRVVSTPISNKTKEKKGNKGNEDSDGGSSCSISVVIRILQTLRHT